MKTISGFVVQFVGTPDMLTPWVTVEKDKPTTFPPCEGVWEIYRDPNFQETHHFMYWSPADPLKLTSADPRCPHRTCYCGGGFTWRGLVKNLT